MHPKFLRADGWTPKVIGAAIEVHRDKGPGLIESIYEKCLMRELFLQGIPACQQLIVFVEYKGFTFEEPLKLDVYVDDCLILELKAVEKVLPIHKTQLLSYMKLLGAPLGLLINFHEPRLADGVHRLLLPGADGSGFGRKGRGEDLETEGNEEQRAMNLHDPSLSSRPSVQKEVEDPETEGNEGSQEP